MDLADNPETFFQLECPMDASLIEVSTAVKHRHLPIAVATSTAKTRSSRSDAAADACNSRIPLTEHVEYAAAA
eukprot:11215114-Lingulodinium_polyedra.AAC.1